MEGFGITTRRSAIMLLGSAALLGCREATAFGAKLAPEYKWTRLTAAAAFPPSYNFPVHTARDGRFVGLHPDGTWSSRDGIQWAKEPLPFSGSNSAYLGTLDHDGTSWALGKMTGNYLDFVIEPIVQRTADYRQWQQVGLSDSLPRVVFYGRASFAGALWIFGGFDGRGTTNAVWRSTNGIDWDAMPAPPWSPRAQLVAATLGDHLLVIGGGEIDGEAGGDVWATRDGKAWERLAERIATPVPVGFTPAEHDGALWLVGANRSGGFDSQMLVTRDGSSWEAVSAPWSPRGGLAAWSDGARLYVTGGKYSVERDGAHQFIYSNDVWAMERV